MKINKTQKISLKVILLFTIAIFSTFVGDYLHSFFDDSYCTIIDCRYMDTRHSLPQWHWGYRHWLYLVMCITLFVIQVIDIISFADSNQTDA